VAPGAAIEQQSPLDDLKPPVRGLILDMDGVLWKDALPIGDLPKVFEAITRRGLSVVTVTNNATKTASQYVEKFRGFGVKLNAAQVITSSEATADTLAQRFGGKGLVFVVGEQGLIDALTARGFRATTDPADPRPVNAVVGSLDRELTYSKLQAACAHVRRGAAFYGTNPDPTFPTPTGLIPGAGSILAAIGAAAEVSPTVIGKPSSHMFEAAARRMRLSSDEILVVGDRLATDVAGGQAFGARTALVLSGVSSEEQARTWRPAPTLVVENLGRLLGL
jgi:4-nitrophenyl phosphatase